MNTNKALFMQFLPCLLEVYKELACHLDEYILSQHLFSIYVCLWKSSYLLNQTWWHNHDNLCSILLSSMWISLDLLVKIKAQNLKLQVLWRFLCSFSTTLSCKNCLTVSVRRKTSWLLLHYYVYGLCKFSAKIF